MKPTELRIGDHVKYQGHIYIVEEISAKGWVHLIHPETKARVNMTSDYIIDLLEPIQLTPDVEKKGFVVEACDNQTPQEAWRDRMTAGEYIKQNVTTIYSGGMNAVKIIAEEYALSAIDLTRKQMVDKACKLLCDICYFNKNARSSKDFCEKCQAEGGDYYRFTKLAEE